jgi:hypothetical protein
LEQFHDCFHHRAQTLALRRYVQGVLSDSGRKSMEAMLARVTDPGHYQALQHFITHAVWDVAPVWRSLLRLLPVRRGVLIIDDTGWLKQGKHSVGWRGSIAGRSAGGQLPWPSPRCCGRATRVAARHDVVCPERLDPRSARRTRAGSPDGIFKRSGVWR